MAAIHTSEFIVHDALPRVDKPGPGVAAIGAVNCGGQSMVALNFYLYVQCHLNTLVDL